MELLFCPNCGTVYVSDYATTCWNSSCLDSERHVLRSVEEEKPNVDPKPEPEPDPKPYNEDDDGPFLGNG